MKKYSPPPPYINIIFCNHQDIEPTLSIWKIKKGALKTSGFFYFTFKYKVLVPSLSIAKTWELSDAAAYALAYSSSTSYVEYQAGGGGGGWQT